MRSPTGYVTAHKDDPASAGDIITHYVAVLAAIPFFAILIGYSLYASINPGVNITNVYGYSTTEFIVVAAVSSYILFVVAVCILGVALRSLAPRFSTSAEGAKPFKVAAYVYTPVFLVSILDIIPAGLAYLSVLGLPYGLYILYKGLPVLMASPKERARSYLIVAVVAAVIAYVLFNEIIYGYVTTGPV